jgi:tetratricopeptide (TPR) repeat protein
MPPLRLLLATACALVSIALPVAAAQEEGASVSQYLVLSEIHRKHGRHAESESVLDRLDAALPPRAVSRFELAEAYARLGRLDRAVSVWEKLVAHGVKLASDETIKLARLREKQGANAEALRTWRALWRQSLSDAQRRVVEERITSMATTLDQLDALTTELEAACRSGTNDLHDAGLLIRWYVRAAQLSPALRAADECLPRAGATPLHVHKERARIHRALGDREGFERDMRRVLALDPAGRPEHLRALVLSELDAERTPRSSNLHSLLDELAASEARKRNLPFEAGVLMKAGLIDEAVVAYRRAAAQSPDSADDHLLLADALVKRGEPEVALAQSQWLAVAGRKPVAFMGAMDALLNVTGARREEEPKSRRTQALLRWSQRQILERIVQVDDGRYLYALKAEFAEAAGDPLRQYAAVEHSLPVADGSRSAVLRQLIVLASPIEGDVETESRGLIKHGDELRERNGRRLLALREAQPPSVYVDAGRDLLIRKDARAAARAFELARAEDSGATLLSRVAETHERAGLHTEALTLYRQALAADTSNLALMNRLASLLATAGLRDESHGLYAATLLGVLSSLPVASPRGMESASYEVRTFYAPALRGLLATWPTREIRANAKLDPIIRLFESALGTSAEANAAALSSRPQLEKASALLRSVFLATGNSSAADSVGEKLRRRFPEDASLERQLEVEREAWGYRSGASHLRPEAAVSFDVALAKAERSMLYNPALNLSVLNADQEQILAAARSWMRSANGGAILEAVDWADHGRLDAPRFAILCSEAAGTIRDSFDVWTQAWGSGASSRVLESIERGLRGPLFSSAEWLERIEREASQSGLGMSVPPRRVGYLVARLSDADRVTLLRGMAEKPAQQMTVLPLWRELLEYPLAPEAASQIETMMRDLFDTRAFDAVRKYPHWVTGQLVASNFEARNSELLAAVMRHWQRRSGADLAHFEALQLLRSGRTHDAVTAFVQAVAGTAAAAAQMESAAAETLFEPVRAVRSAFIPEHAAELSAYLDAPSHRSDALVAAARVHIFHPDPRRDDASAVAALRAAVDLDPTNEAFLVRLQRLYQRAGALADSILMLEHLWRLDDAEPLYRGFLYAAYIVAGRVEDAARLNAASPEDMSHPAFLPSLPQRQRSSKNLLAASLEPTFSPPASASLPAQSGALEDILRGTPIEEEESLGKVYGALADAYADSGQTAPRLSALFERVFRGEANVRESTLWMAMLARDLPRRLDERVSSVLDAQLASGHEDSTFRVLLMARLYGACGRMPRALEVYRLAAARSLGWAPDVLGAIEEGSVPSVTASMLLREAKRDLDPSSLRELVAGVKRLLQPGPAASRRMREAYDRFWQTQGIAVSPISSATAGATPEEPELEPSDAAAERRFLAVMGARSRTE